MSATGAVNKVTTPGTTHGALTDYSQYQQYQYALNTKDSSQVKRELRAREEGQGV